MILKPSPRTVQGSSKDRPRMVQGWFKDGSRMVQGFSLEGYSPKPIFDGGGMSFILFGDEEPNEFGVTHPRMVTAAPRAAAVPTAASATAARAAPVNELGHFRLRRSSRHGSRKYPVDHLRRQCCKTSQKHLLISSMTTNSGADAAASVERVTNLSDRCRSTRQATRHLSHFIA